MHDAFPPSLTQVEPAGQQVALVAASKCQRPTVPASAVSVPAVSAMISVAFIARVLTRTSSSSNPGTASPW